MKFNVNILCRSRIHSLFDVRMKQSADAAYVIEKATEQPSNDTEMIDEGLAKLKKLSSGNAEQNVDFSTSFNFMQRTL